MKQTLLKRCQKPLSSNQREKNMSVMGREIFDKKEPRRDIPMYNVREDKLKTRIYL